MSIGHIDTGGNSAPIFELFDTTMAKTMPDVFGMWTTAPLSPSKVVAFDTPAGTITEILPEVSIWRVTLPRNLNAASSYLAGGKSKLAVSQKAIKKVPDRLDALIQTQSSGLSFDISSKERRLAQPEADLLASLSEIQEGRTPVSFGLGEKLRGGWQQATDQFQAFVNQLLQSLAHYAWVETCIQEQCLGRTGVSWTGDMNTVWRHRLTSTQATLHQCSLELALASRNELLQTLNIAIRGTLQLSALLAAPGSAILALPAVWRFINKILAEVGNQ